MVTLYLPDIRIAISRLAAGKNTNGEQVASSLQDWSASFEKVSSGFSWNKVRSFCLSATMSYPIADERQLFTAAQWPIILFAWDDIFDVPERNNLMEDAKGANEINDRIFSIMDNTETLETPERPVIAAFREMWAQFCATSTPTMQKRFGDGIRRYANAAQGVVHNRENRRNYSVEEYVVTRRDFGGVESCLACVEYCLGIEIPDEAIYHPAMQELRDCINDVITRINDLYSFNKEQAAGDYHNLVAVVAIERNIDVQSAIEVVLIMIQATIDRYFEVKAHLPKFDPKTDELLSRYATGIECVCSGLVLWHFETDRYFGSRVGDVQGRIPVKVLPREKDAVDPGFELKYNTLTASLGNAESASKDAP